MCAVVRVQKEAHERTTRGASQGAAEVRKTACVDEVWPHSPENVDGDEKQKQRSNQ